MKISALIVICIAVTFIACSPAREKIVYSLYSNGELVFNVNPDNIEYYDTTRSRSYIQIHEIRLKDDFFTQDSFVLQFPIELVCRIGNQQYFWSDFFPKNRVEPRLWVNFKFHSSCRNEWTFQEQKPGSVVLKTTNDCNSIELFHSQDEISKWGAYYEQKNYFRNYIDTARLAHEILIDPYYLKAIVDSGILIK